MREIRSSGSVGERGGNEPLYPERVTRDTKDMGKRQFLFGSVSGVVQLVFIAALAIECIPVFIGKLGSEAYGVFAVVSLVGNLTVFANLGTNRSLVKFIAEQGRTRESSYDIAITLLILIATIVPITLLFILLREVVLIKLFNVPPGLFDQAMVLYICLLFSNLFLLMGQSFSSILSALQKIYINNLLQMVYNALYYGSIIAMLLLGYGLAEIGYVILLSAFAWFFLVFYYSLRLWGKLEIGGITHHYKRIARKQFGYGSKIWFSEMVAFFIEPLTKIFISNFVGIREVGFFDIALKVKAQFQGLITRLLDPFYPFISQISDSKKLQRIINDVEQKFLFLSIPLIAILLFTLRPLLSLWLGAHSNEEITVSSILITCTFLLTMSVLPMYYFLLAKDRVGRATVLNLVTVGVNGLLFFIFYRGYGFYASVISLCGSAMVAFFLTLYYQKKYLDCILFSSPEPVLKIITAFSILVLTNYLITRFTPSAILQILFVTVNTIILSVITYRFLNLVGKTDIETYFGRENVVSRFLVRVFVKSVTRVAP